MSDIYICKNCKYFKPNYKNLRKSYCKYPISQYINIVSGQTTYDYAETMRKNICGKSAIFYEKENKLKLIYRDIRYNMPELTYIYSTISILIIIIITIIIINDIQIHRG